MAKQSTRSTQGSGRAVPGVAPDSVGAVLADVLAELRRQLAVVEARREALADGGFDPDLANAAASLARAAAQTASQLRQQEKHDRAMRPVAESPEQRELVIREAFEGLPRPRQVETARALVQIAGDGLLLSR